MFFLLLAKEWELLTHKGHEQKKVNQRYAIIYLQFINDLGTC